uniref:tRNA modification GTPase MnmE n=1 Tax=Chlorobium chlorochromatii (strain CaD3) TaxID=340177 RepID=MNME_CHLCH|nr:RecName: Full=tRNA modification GTPase MnmE [Chlorobium chlorochromatii CaD3]
MRNSLSFQDEPIVALATPLGVGALAVVRMSGQGVFDIARKVFHKQGAPDFHLASSKGFQAHFGTIHDAQGVVDEVIALVFRSPRSFTMEDMVEFSCHGGPVVVQHLLKALIDAGCRLAEPGEFTRRAFLNGRIDLLQAEAIGEMIHARSESAFRTAVTQMQGRLSRQLEEMREKLLHSCALLELELDFSEEDVEFQNREELREDVQRLQGEINRLLDSYQHGRLLKEGVATVLVGSPNAGKSTLLNALLGEERSIVSHQPGTTRDYIEEPLLLGSTLFRLIDTAGLREGEEEVEHEGIRRSYRKIAEADVVLYLLDVSHPDYCNELSDITSLLEQASPNVQLLLVANKCDAITNPTERLAQLQAAMPQATVCGIAAKEGDGLEALKQQMSNMVAGLDKLHEASVLITSMRHYEALRRASDALENGACLVAEHAETELVAFELRSALEAVGEITGKVVNDEILSLIFERFCIGK